MNCICQIFYFPEIICILHITCMTVYLKKQMNKSDWKSTRKVRSGGLNIPTLKVNWTESEASFVIGHVISTLPTQASNRGFIWHAHLCYKLRSLNSRHITNIYLESQHLRVYSSRLRITQTVITTWIPEMLGRFFKIWIKCKLKDFQITWANILFTIEHR